jgi:hypothetical protein
MTRGGRAIGHRDRQGGGGKWRRLYVAEGNTRVNGGVCEIRIVVSLQCAPAATGTAHE